MKQNKQLIIIISVACVLTLMTISTAHATDKTAKEKSYHPLLPYSSWGEITYSENGFCLNSYSEQGVDWFNINKWTFNTFVGISMNTSNKNENWWDNKVAPWVGIKAKRKFLLHEKWWGGIELGTQVGYKNYFSSHSNENGLIYFGRWSFGGNWKNLNNNKFPLRYPLSSWGQISHATDDFAEGTVLSGYLEQGIDWTQHGKWITNTFIGLRFTDSNKDDYWNNKIAPWVGIKMKRPINLSSDSWGEIAIGTRMEFNNYTDGNRHNDTLIVVFFQWSFGGE